MIRNLNRVSKLHAVEGTRKLKDEDKLNMHCLNPRLRRKGFPLPATLEGGRWLDDKLF